MRVLWDAVPADVQAELELRTDVKPKGVAIITRDEGRTRWYFRKEQFGWNNISVDREAAAQEAASDLTDEQRSQALAQVAKVEEALKAKLATRPAVERREATTIDPNKPCPARANGNHSFNGTKHLPDGTKMGVCPCGAEAVIPGPKDPLYCPAYTDHRHNLVNGRCTCGTTVGVDMGVPNFDYRREPGVSLEVEQEVQRDPIVYGRVRLPRLEKRRTFINLQIARHIALRDGWNFSGFMQFKLTFDAGPTPVVVTCRLLTLNSNASGDVDAKAEVIFN